MAVFFSRFKDGTTLGSLLWEAWYSSLFQYITEQLFAGQALVHNLKLTFHTLLVYITEWASMLMVLWKLVVCLSVLSLCIEFILSFVCCYETSVLLHPYICPVKRSWDQNLKITVSSCFTFILYVNIEKQKVFVMFELYMKTTVIQGHTYCHLHPAGCSW